jgi:hypothetical protein
VDGQEGTSYIVTADSSYMLNDAEQDSGCADLDGTVAVIYAVDKVYRKETAATSRPFARMHSFYEAETNDK